VVISFVYEEYVLAIRQQAGPSFVPFGSRTAPMQAPPKSASES